jgi:hypothetical protein
MRPDDVPKLPGAQVYGYMPRRGDFDIEWDNDAEEAIADMEFFKHESESDKKLKLRVLQIYSHKLQEREQRKQFILSRRLYDYTARQQELDRLPRDERDLVLRMRMFERYHTVAEHQQFIGSLLKAKRLRKRIAKLQMYRRMGIQTLADAERYELDKMRHGGNVSAGGGGGLPPPHGAADIVADGEPSYFKQYKTSDRKIRKSVNRGMMPLITTANNTTTTTATTPLTHDAAASTPAAATPAPADGAAKRNSIRSPVIMERLGDIVMKDDNEVEESPNTASPAADGVVSPQPPPDALMTASEAAGTPQPPPDAVMTAPEEAATPQPPPDAVMTAPEEAATTTDVAAADAARPAETAPEQEAKQAEEEPIEEDRPDDLTLLSVRERELCQSIDITPTLYLKVKRALIRESFTSKVASEGPLVKIDVERKGAILEFVIRAGWVPASFGRTEDSVMT